MKKQLLTILLLFSFTTCFCQKEDSLQNAQGISYAILIAENNYEDNNIQNLEYPIKDADTLAKVLTRLYTFEKENVFVLKDANKRQIIKEMAELAKKIKENDNLLIFYAGHGRAKNNVSFLLPSDAIKDDFLTWLNSDELISIIKHIEAKHILLVIDASVGSSLIMRYGHNDSDNHVLEAKQSRTVISSGVVEEVPDQSIFMKYLIKTLNTIPDKHFSASHLLHEFQSTVTVNSPNRQIPQEGALQQTGHEGGDFIFHKK